MSRLWLGDRHVAVGDTLRLTGGGYTGVATVVAIGPIHAIAEGGLLIDPRTRQLVQSAGCDLTGSQYYIAYADGGVGCVMPDEQFAVVELGAGPVPGSVAGSP
jgi:hypothetical protein